MRFWTIFLAITVVLAGSLQAATFNVKDYGAAGDGKTLDNAAINKAIEAAAAAGGGIVFFPAGTYISGSMRLKSHITLQLSGGTVLEASADGAAYDQAEPNESNKYQDFGHSHWHNSLIWGEGLEGIAITGPGLLQGKGLARGERAQGGNKTIALKLCRNVTLCDFAILNGGHFGLLATGVENLTIDNLRIDTNRDGIDIDSCRNVRISNVSVNSPNDDAIVLKTSRALGFAKPTENVIITNCLVSGYDIGSLLDGTCKRTVIRAPDRDGPTGRIKLGTESEGDFRNIPISNIVFGLLPAYGFFIRHAAGIGLDHVRISFAKEDLRPALVLEDINGIELHNVHAQKVPGATGIRLKNVRGLVVQSSSMAPDGRMEQIEEKELK